MQPGTIVEAEKNPISGALLEEDKVFRKITFRIMPLLMALFIMAWIDRVNIGFAKLSMLGDLQFSEAVYGMGAGIFFIGYFLFEVPSNLLLHRIGARKTLARIAMLWGLATVAMAFVTTPAQFYAVRFLLGVFEAGLVPGGVLYLTYWYPSHRRAQMVGLFISSAAVAGILGGPLAGWIMSSTGSVGDLTNWQWLFILEGIPSILLGGVILYALADKPESCSWLDQSEKNYVLAELDRDHESAGPRQKSFAGALKNPKIWLLAFIFFCLVSGNLALSFYSPSIIKALNVNDIVHIGLLSAIPYIAAAIGMVLYGRHSDRMNERRLHFALAAFVGGVSLISLGMLTTPIASMIALTIAQTAILAGFAVFWEIPMLAVSGAAAAGSIALINSLGNLSGFVGPNIIGTVKQITGSYAGGLYFMGGLEITAAILVVLFVSKNTVAR